MSTPQNFPVFDDQLALLDQFILDLVDAYQSGELNSWDELDEKVKSFFTFERMKQTESLVPGWKKMSSYSDGITLTHVMCVFLGVYMLPEFQALTPERQQIAKWFVLFHDLDKFHIRGKKDSMHAFNSGVLTAQILPKFGFLITEKYHEMIDSWSELTTHAFSTHSDDTAPKPDNQKLPEILAGIDDLFGENTPATLITKVALLHISLNIDPLYPTPAPLSNAEIKRFITPSLFPLLKVMMLGDNEGWALFSPEDRRRQSKYAVEAFEKVEKIISVPSNHMEEPHLDKEFWETLAKNDYAIPTGYTLRELKETLFSYLGNTDPELRDEIAYIVYANWLKREMFTKEEVGAHIDELLANLDKGIGETETDSVFLRAFSVLLLAEIVHNDNKKPLLEKDQIQSILAKGIWYLNAEKDPRGHIPVKGWAHALAHTADLMLVLGKNRQTEKDDLEKILQGISNKLVHSTNWVYIHGEEDRLTNAVMVSLKRNLLTNDFVGSWLKSFTAPEKSWDGAFIEEGQVKAFHNSQNFLRSLLINILASTDLPEKDKLETLVSEAVTALAPY